MGGDDDNTSPSGRKYGDHLASKYSGLADDSKQNKQQREAAMLYSIAEKYIDQDDVEEGLKNAKDALKVFRDTKYARGVADTLRLIARGHILQEKYDDAEEVVGHELARFREDKDKLGEAKMLLASAEVANARGKASGIPEAVESAEKARDAFGSEPQWKGRALLELASLTMKKKGNGKSNCSDAVALGEEALETFKKAGDRFGEGQALSVISVAMHGAGRADEWLTSADDALELFQELGDDRLEAQQLVAMAEIYLADGNAKEARKLAGDAVDIFHFLGPATLREVPAITAVTNADLVQGWRQRALKSAYKGLWRMWQAEEPAGEACCHDLLVQCYMDEWDPEEAMKCAHRAMNIYRDDLKDTKNESRMLRALSNIHLALDQKKDAIANAEKAMNMFQELGEADESASTLEALCQVHLSDGKPEEALAAAEELRSSFKGERAAEAKAMMIMCNAYFLLERYEECLSTAKAAEQSFEEDDDKTGQGNACSMQTNCYAALNQHEKALAAAKKGRTCYKDNGDKVQEATMALAAVNAQIMVTTGGKKAPTRKQWEDCMKMAKEGLKLARGVDDMQSTGSALFMVAHIHVANERFDEGIKAAAEAVEVCQGAGMSRQEASSLLLLCRSYLAQRKMQECYDSAQQALLLCGEIADSGMEGICQEYIDVVEQSMGWGRYSQQAMMMQMQAQGGGVPVVPIWQQQQMAAAAQQDAGGPQSSQQVARQRGEAVSVSGLDISVITEKVKTISAQLMGFDSPDDLEVDAPFMESGLTSSTSVLLRDEIMAEMQGVNLPFTLVFDYPTVASVADFIGSKT